MTLPFSLFESPLNPSMQDFNILINELNTLFPNVSVVGDEAVSGNLAVAGTTALTGNATAAGTLIVTGLTTLNGGLAGGASADIAINTDKFTVDATQGNTLVAGTFNATGAILGSTTITAGTAMAAGTTVTAGSYFLNSVGDALTAVGTTRADALQLAAGVNNITTAAASTGVVLPEGVVGMQVIIEHAGANAIKVYALASETIDAVAGATGVTLTNAKRCMYLFTAANTWISMQMGVISA